MHRFLKVCPAMPQLLDKKIDVLRIKYLRGPNQWTAYYYPVMEAWIDIGELEDYPSDRIPGLYERMVACLPSLIEHRCSVGERGGFLQRLQRGTWPAHILEHLTLELQQMAGFKGGFGRARDGDRVGVYRVALSAWHEEVTRVAFQQALDLLMALIQDREGPETDVPALVARLRDMADRLCLGPSTACIVNAAEARGIPATRLSEGNLVQLGYGARQRRIWTAETDSTSAIAEGISRDKALTKSLLSAVGVPVPEGRLVGNADEAWEAAEDIGLPVVVKPQDGNHGRGVFVNLSTRAEVDMAYAVAVEEGSGVIVERFIPGDEHRLLVVGRRVVAASRGEVARVCGDGIHTVAELIELQLNADPRRGRNEDSPLNPVRIDRAVSIELSRQGLTPESCPTAGRWVVVQPNGNVAIDVTDRVHPQVARQVVLAARVVGLEIAGIDLVATDISRPLDEQGAAIVEVNAGPGLLMHLKPASGEAQPVGEAIVGQLFPADSDCRIPVVGVSGSRDKTAVAELVAHFLRLAGLHVGLACSNGLYLGERRVMKGDADNRESGHRLLLNPTVEAAVIENGNRTLLNEGYAYDRCQVGIITHIDPSERHPDCAVLDEDQLLYAMRSQIDVVLPSGMAVLNGDDERIVPMASLCNGGVTFFTRHPESAAMAAHLEAGGRAVVIERQGVRLQQGAGREGSVHFLRIAHIQCLRGSARAVHVAAAVGAAWALGLSPQLIEAAIETFETFENEATALLVA
jgi:cyanophycin synthetase